MRSPRNRIQRQTKDKDKPKASYRKLHRFQNNNNEKMAAYVKPEYTFLMSDITQKRLKDYYLTVYDHWTEHCTPLLKKHQKNKNK